MTKLREKRLAYGMTQRELAQAAHVSTSYICEYESGNKAPTVLVAKKLADVFGMKPERLFATIQPKLSRRNGHHALPCPPKIPCSWCAVPVCPNKCKRVEVGGRVLMLGHEWCIEEHERTAKFA